MNYSSSEIKFLNMIYEARKINFDIDKIIKKDNKKQEEKRKILIAINKMIFDKDIVEATMILYRKNKIVKLVFKKFINYYIVNFQGNSDNIDDELDEDEKQLLSYI